MYTSNVQLLFYFLCITLYSFHLFLVHNYHAISCSFTYIKRTRHYNTQTHRKQREGLYYCSSCHLNFNRSKFLSLEQVSRSKAFDSTYISNFVLWETPIRYIKYKIFYVYAALNFETSIIIIVMVKRL